MLLTDSQTQYWLWPGRYTIEEDGAEWTESPHGCRCYAVTATGHVLRVLRPRTSLATEEESTAYATAEQLRQNGYELVVPRQSEKGLEYHPVKERKHATH